VRKSVLIAVAVVASLALSACGTTAAAKKVALDQFVASMGTSPNVQVHLTASVAGAGTSKQVRSILHAFSLDVNVSSPTGAALAQVGDAASTELLVNVSGAPLLDVREVADNVYLKVDVSALSSIPGSHIPTVEAALAELLVGGRWFEVPESVLQSMDRHEHVPTARLAGDRRLEARLIDALTTLIDTSPYSTSTNGFAETGTLQAVVDAVAPALQQFAHSTTKLSVLQGHYTVSLTTSGTSLTGASVAVTVPSGPSGTVTSSVTATVAHDDVAVVAPSGATPITPALLASLGLSGVLEGP
jgi:hypothetical protein